MKKVNIESTDLYMCFMNNFIRILEVNLLKATRKAMELKSIKFIHNMCTFITNLAPNNAENGC